MLDDTFFSDIAASLSVGEPFQLDGIAIAPIRRGPSGPELVTLREALSRGEAEVTELEGGGSVPEVRVRNLVARPLLLIQGEELLGAKQNRVLNTSVLVPPSSVQVVPVSCIEAGRWSQRSHGFASSDRSLPLAMRSSVSRRVSSSLEQTGGFDAGQREVWREVEEYSTTRRVRSQTRALSDAFDAERERTEGLRARLPEPGEHDVGCALWIDGSFAAADLFGRPEVWREAFRRVTFSYLSDVPSEAHTVARPSDVAAFLAAFAGTQPNVHRGVGLGVEIRAQCPIGSISALVDDSDALVHLQAFGARASQPHAATGA